MNNTSASVALRVLPWPVDWVRAGLCAVLTGLLVYAFWFQEAERGFSCYRWMTTHWMVTSNYSHGPLIPLIASFLLYWTVAQRAPADTDWQPFWNAMIGGGCVLGIWMVGSAIDKSWEPTAYNYSMMLLPVAIVWQVWTLRRWLGTGSQPLIGPGLTIIAGALLLYYIGIKATQPRLVVTAGILILYGLVLFFRGRDGWRVLFFPITFLFLMVPLNFLDNVVGFPLRMFVAKAATIILNGIGIETWQRGSGMVSLTFQFDVADPCSGIRSLMALTTVTAAYGYITQRVVWKKWVLFCSAVPLAVLGNLARVISIAVVAQVYGREVANKTYHDWSGFILFPVALVAMVILGVALNLPYRRYWQHLTQPPT